MLPITVAKLLATPSENTLSRLLSVSCDPLCSHTSRKKIDVKAANPYLVFKLLHFFIKMQPSSSFDKQSINALPRCKPPEPGGEGNDAKTTSQLIAERVLQESKIMLKHAAWSVSEIAYASGFREVTYFNNFFKKHLAVSPLKFRNG